VESLVRRGASARGFSLSGVLAGRRYASVGEVVRTDRGERSASVARVYTTIYELASPQAVQTPEFQAMRGWYQFAPRVRSRTSVMLPT